MAPRTDNTRTVPAEPFIAWLREAEEREGSRAALAQLIGQSERWVWRYRSKLNGGGKPTETFLLEPVEDALDRAGVRLHEVYPELLEEVEVRERYCPSCDEGVFADEDEHCLWCLFPTVHPDDLVGTVDERQRLLSSSDEADLSNPKQGVPR